MAARTPRSEDEPRDNGAGRVSTGELVSRSSPVLDLAPRTARLIAVAGAVGVVLVVVGSLTGNQPQTVEVDKLLHFGGYAVLAALFVVALSPRRYVLALSGLALLGAVIELLQPLNARSRDSLDLVANLLGIAVGAALGLGARLTYGAIKGELVSAHIRRNLLKRPAGAVIVREGEPIETFFIVRSGLVELSRTVDGGQVEVRVVGAGAMFGLLAEVLHIPQYATAVARTPVELYQVDFDAVIADAGGREQPLGVVLTALAQDLHEAWETIAALRGEARPPLTSFPE